MLLSFQNNLIIIHRKEKKFNIYVLFNSGLPRGFGFSVDVSVEPSEENNLPTISTISLEGGALKFAQLDSTNSERLAANFVLQLNKPLPVSIMTAKLLQKVTSPDTPFFHESLASLDDLIIEQKFGMTRQTWSEEEFCIELPEEIHEFRCLPSDRENIGLMMCKIPFNQVSQIPHVIKVGSFRAFNSLIYYFLFEKLCYALMTKFISK